MTPDELLTEIYSAFEPFQPPSKEAYVDCQEVRGKWDVVRELGRKITRSKQPTCQLYTGHRGVGKSTELLRLKEYLEAKGYCVVDFAADNEDIEPQDTEYADILFACTKHLVKTIRLKNHNPLLEWMKSRWQSLKELALTELEFEGLDLEGQIAQFGKITANLRAVPDQRREIRHRINANTPSLIEALNDFIREAQKTLSDDCSGIVIIADNLDRIVETQEEGKPSNYDEIYLNRSELLRGLACHVIYTVPIAMVYSERATRLEDIYDKPDVLPMVMVRNSDGEINKLGLAKLREVIAKRIELIDPKLAEAMDTKVFENSGLVDTLCLMSGGHVRILMQLIQRAVDWTDELPIGMEAVQNSIEEARETYTNTVLAPQWPILAKVCKGKRAENNEQHLRLLFNRCLLEYRYYDDGGKLRRWHNVHPLIEEIEQFQNALLKLQSNDKESSD
jgi:hypothetical protein